MRVVFTPHAYRPSIGGAERYCQGLAEGLARLGHEVHVVVADIDDPEAFYQIGHQSVGRSEEKIEGVAVHRLPYIGFEYRRMGWLWGQRVLRSSTTGFLGRLGDRLAELKPEVVVTLPHLFPNVEGTLGQRESASWKLIYAPMLHEDDPYWSVQQVAAAVAQCDAIMALTEHEKERLLESYGADPARTAVIPPGVEPGRGVEVEDRDPIVLFVGRRTRSKRLDVLYEAMKLVWEEHPDAVLQLAGSPPGTGSDPAVWMAADPRVKIVTGPSEQVKDDLLGNATVVVSPSVTESFGISTLEAWAHGTPVVLVDSPVNRSVVRDGVDGLLASGVQASQLGVAIAQIVRDPGLARRLGNAGRDRVEAEFSWDGSVRRLGRLMEFAG